MPRPRTKTRALGMLDPDRIYTSYGLVRHGGIGETTQADMRQSGMVEPIEQGNYVWYRGSEVIAWIESQAKAEGQKKKKNRFKVEFS